MISIIIPVYNRAHIIKETLDSVRNQSSGDWECILVDDGSTDGSIELIKTYKEKWSTYNFNLKKNRGKITKKKKDVKISPIEIKIAKM